MQDIVFVAITTGVVGAIGAGGVGGANDV